MKDLIEELIEGEYYTIQEREVSFPLNYENSISLEVKVSFLKNISESDFVILSQRLFYCCKIRNTKSVVFACNSERSGYIFNFNDEPYLLTVHIGPLSVKEYYPVILEKI